MNIHKIKKGIDELAFMYEHPKYIYTYIYPQ